jgi:hypothetical protein
MIYDLMNDTGKTFIGWLLLECLGDKYLHLGQDEYIDKMSKCEIEMKINGEEVYFVDTIRFLEGQMDRIVLKKANEIIEGKQYQLDRAFNEYKETIEDIMSR